MKWRKEQWEVTTLGEMVTELRENSGNPIEEGYEKYIGFEHIEPENLYLNTFRNLSDGVTFQRVFKKDDVLFGKIRAYLKKVAVAPIDGICSGDILVLRTLNNDRLSQKLLPYYITTESFLNRAITSSIGTTLPRTKWKHLIKHEIRLPQPEEQKQITALFQDIESIIEQVEVQEQRMIRLKQQSSRNIFGHEKAFGTYLSVEDFETKRFERIAFQISEREEPKETDYDKYVGLEHLQPNSLMIEKTGRPSDVIGTKLRIYKGDIIFGKRRAYQRKVAVSHFEGIASAHSMILRAKRLLKRNFYLSLCKVMPLWKEQFKFLKAHYHLPLNGKRLQHRNLSYPKKRSSHY